MYVDSHVQDKTIARPSYLFYGDPYTGKTVSIYWNGPQVPNPCFKTKNALPFTGTSIIYIMGVSSPYPDNGIAIPVKHVLFIEFSGMLIKSYSKIKMYVKGTTASTIPFKTYFRSLQDLHEQPSGILYLYHSNNNPKETGDRVQLLSNVPPDINLKLRSVRPMWSKHWMRHFLPPVMSWDRAPSSKHNVLLYA